MNKNLKETKETNNKKVKVKFPCVQSEGLLQINKQVNKTESRPYGFYSNMSDKELIAESRKYCGENINTKRKELETKNRSLYIIMRKRNLLDSVFGQSESKPRGFYSNMGDKELIDYGKKYCKENIITKRDELKTKNSSLHQQLWKRNLLDSVFGILETKPPGFYSKKTDDELVEYTQNFCKKNNVKKRKELETKNGSLYNEMRKRNLLDSVFGQSESKPRGFYSNMSDEELIDYGKKYCEVNKIIIRKTLKNTNLGLYDVLNKRNLLDSVGLNKNNGDWISMSDGELIEYGKDFCNKHDLSLRKNLRKKSESLYHVLCRRKLLDSVFSEQSHLNDLVDAIRNFGSEKDK